MKAFSLLELLVVMAVAGVLTALILPAMNSIQDAQSVTRGGSTVSGALTTARQLAVARNRTIEVRFVEMGTGSEAGYRAVQLWITSEDGSTVSPLTRLEMLPPGTIISNDTTLSPLLTADASVSGTATFGSTDDLSYKGFRIRPSGGLGADISMGENFVTVQQVRDEGLPPENFCAIRINPITGRTIEYRP